MGGGAAETQAAVGRFSGIRPSAKVCDFIQITVFNSNIRWLLHVSICGQRGHALYSQPRFVIRERFSR